MEEMIKEILIIVKRLEERMDRFEEKMDRLEERMDKSEKRQDSFEEKLDRMQKDIATEIRELAESISRAMNKQYQELLNKIEEVIKENRIDHERYEIKFNKLEAGQKYLDTRMDDIIAQKVG